MDVAADPSQFGRCHAPHEIAIRSRRDMQQRNDIGAHFAMPLHGGTQELLAHQLVEEQRLPPQPVQRDLAIGGIERRSIGCLQTVGPAPAALDALSVGVALRGRIGRGPADAERFEPSHETGLGVARRWAGRAPLGAHLGDVPPLALGHRRQRALRLDLGAVLVFALAVDPQEAVESGVRARGGEDDIPGLGADLDPHPLEAGRGHLARDLDVASVRLSVLIVSVANSTAGLSQRALGARHGALHLMASGGSWAQVACRRIPCLGARLRCRVATSRGAGRMTEIDVKGW